MYRAARSISQALFSSSPSPPQSSLAAHHRKKSILAGDAMAKKRARGSGSGVPPTAPPTVVGKNSLGWEKSTITAADLVGPRRFGLIPPEQDKVCLAGLEIVPKPDPGWRVVFLPCILRGLSFPVHTFIRNLLFVYGIQLHQLTPNSFLHLSVFLTVCECFLGIHPHWGLFKYLFQAKRLSGNFDAGGFGLSIRPDIGYFKFQMVDSAQGWRKRWFYIRDEPHQGRAVDLEPFVA